MTNKTFWCDYEMARFPVAELRRDIHGNLIHMTPGPCHHPNGIPCSEPSPPAFNLSRDEVEQIYNDLPDQNKSP